MVKVIGIGDSMVDKNLTTGIMYPGGQSLNIPVNMHFLGSTGCVHRLLQATTMWQST